MIDYSNPDAAHIFRDRYDKITEQFRQGVFSEVVLRATLRGMGYAGRRLDDECAYQRTLIGPQPIAKAAERVVSGLRDER